MTITGPMLCQAKYDKDVKGRGLFKAAKFIKGGWKRSAAGFYPAKSAERLLSSLEAVLYGNDGCPGAVGYTKLGV